MIRVNRSGVITISTHAPAGGATPVLRLPEYRYAISTHAPAGGATNGLLANNQPNPLFLLTPLREGRRGTIKRAASDLWISTHAPAGGATLAAEWAGFTTVDFYSRPCGRGDISAPASGPVYGISTHAPAGGATLICDGAVRSGKFLLTPLREGRRQFSTSPS